MVITSTSVCWRLGPWKMHLPLSQSLAATHVPQSHCRALETLLPRSLWTPRPVQLHPHLELPPPAVAPGPGCGPGSQGGESTARPSWKLLHNPGGLSRRREEEISSSSFLGSWQKPSYLGEGGNGQFLWPTTAFTLLTTFLILFASFV